MAADPNSDQFFSSSLSRRGEVEPFYAMDILAKANRLKQEGENISFLCVGQPSAPAPQSALDAARQHLESGVVSYTDAGGKQDLRSRIARHMFDKYGVELEADRVFVTTGSSAGFNLAFLALFNAGDTVAIASPGYPAYRNILKAMSLNVVEIETTNENRHAITPEALLAAHKNQPIAGILIASPANPTGTMMTPENLESLIQCCHENGIRFISDEIYHGLSYGEDTGLREATALEFSDDVVVINSFSKYYCMTGWRIGWMVLPKDLVRPIERLAQSLYISAPELSQIAAMHALDGSHALEATRQSYRANRELLLERLPQLGFVNMPPIDGAFYAYADASNHTNDTMDLCHRILEQAHVAITPGVDFDINNGHRFVRISFAGQYDDIVGALDRMEKLLVL